MTWRRNLMQRKHMIAAILAVAALFATFTVANVDNNEADTGETTWPPTSNEAEVSRTC